VLTVNGNVVISSKSPIDETKVEKGSFFNFVVVSQSPQTKEKTEYNASLFVPKDETVKWRETLKAGVVLYIEIAHWAMQKYEGGKYPIPKLKLNRFFTHKMEKAHWTPKE
jgi:hypothetical protein